MFVARILKLDLVGIALLMTLVQAQTGCGPEDGAGESSEPSALVTYYGGSAWKRGTLQSATTGLCLDANGGRVGVQPYMRECTPWADRRRRIAANENLNWWFKDNGANPLSSNVGTCLTGNHLYETPWMQLSCATDPMSQWEVVYVPGDWFMVKLQYNGLCLDANTGQFGRAPYMRQCDPNNVNLLWR